MVAWPYIAKTATELVFVNIRKLDTSARTAMVHQYANTVNYGTTARNAKELAFVFIITSAPLVKIAGAPRFVHTAASAGSAKMAAVDHKSVCTIARNIVAENAGVLHSARMDIRKVAAQHAVGAPSAAAAVMAHHALQNARQQPLLLLQRCSATRANPRMPDMMIQ